MKKSSFFILCESDKIRPITTVSIFVNKGVSMSDALYFQWQNDVLRKSIYPLREMKLRDFLVYFREIELWKEYKKKDISGEVSDYLEKKKQAVKDVVQQYYGYQDYFKDPNVKVIYAKHIIADDEMTGAAYHAIDNIHKTFNTYLDQIEDKPRHETYFLSQRVLYLLDFRKEFIKKIAFKQRLVDAMSLTKPNTLEFANLQRDLKNMNDHALKMIDMELERLYAYTAALGKVEKRKMDLMKDVDAAEKKKNMLMLPKRKKIKRSRNWMC